MIDYVFGVSQEMLVIEIVLAGVEKNNERIGTGILNLALNWSLGLTGC